MPDQEQKTPPEAIKRLELKDFQSNVLNLAKMCKESNTFADCVIRCDDDDDITPSVRAHKLILGAASPFMKNLFANECLNSSESTIIVPGIKRQVVSSLIDFLYTGDMVINRDDTADLQRILDILQINPSLISVDTVQSLQGAKEKVEDKEDDKDSSVSDNESPDTVQAEKATDGLVENDVQQDKEDEENELRSRKRKLGENEASEDTKRQK